MSVPETQTRTMALRVSDVQRLAVRDLKHGMRHITRVDWAPMQALVDGFRPVTAADVRGLLHEGTLVSHQRSDRCISVPCTREAVDAALEMIADVHQRRTLKWLVDSWRPDWPSLRTCYRKTTGMSLKTKRDWHQLNDADIEKAMLWTHASELALERGVTDVEAMHELLVGLRGFAAPQTVDQVLAELAPMPAEDEVTFFMRRTDEPFAVVLSDTAVACQQVSVCAASGRLNVVVAPTTKNDYDSQYFGSFQEASFTTVPELCGWLDTLRRDRDGRSYSSFTDNQPETPRFKVVCFGEENRAGANSRLQIGRIGELGHVLVEYSDPTPTTYDRERAKLKWLPEHKRKKKVARSEPLVKELREQAKRLGVKGVARMGEPELKLAIAQVTVDAFAGRELPEQLPGGGFVTGYGWDSCFSRRYAKRVKEEGRPAAVLAKRLPGGFAHRDLPAQPQRVADSEPRSATVYVPLNPFGAE